MVLETQPQSFVAWLPGAIVHWLVVVALFGALVFLAMAARVAIAGWHDGMPRAAQRFMERLGSVARDLLDMSLRRTLVLARLVRQESMRRRGWVVLVLFVGMMAVALWFLDRQSPDPAVLYVSSVQWGTTLLALVTVMLLAAVSLPMDIKNKTIYTIVTKPVRAGEIVLGRIVGITLLGTAMLVVMGLCDYVFVHRALEHTHELSPEALVALEAPGSELRAVLGGETSTARNHRHRALVDVDGSGSTDVVQGHWHRITPRAASPGAGYALGEPLGQFRARVPRYGTLRFLDRAGKPAERGINVGDIWSRDSYIAGGTLAEAIWTFDGVTPERFGQGLRVDLNIRVFRTHKGEIERGVAGSMVARNPRTRRTSAPYNFLAKEFVVDPHLLPRKLADPDGKPIDLFDDLVDDDGAANGRVEIVLQCLDAGQFFGMAEPDLYLLERDASVGMNFVKDYIGIWLQMVLIVSFGVMWSTLLNASVSVLAILGTLFVGYLKGFILQLANNEVAGGGTFESLVRIVQQKGAKVPLDETWSLHVVNTVDEAIRWGLWALAEVVPDLRGFSFADHLAYGYDIPWDNLAIQAATMIGFAVPAFLFGYLCFKFREVAQ
ncbi:MAG TPA: hypothetical protein VHZ24_18940 [Pirellulales bacterium]|jgi:hypothetical protein|nr:hypothetical protein [Pirellulales bacterium]